MPNSGWLLAPAEDSSEGSCWLAPPASLIAARAELEVMSEAERLRLVRESKRALRQKRVVKFIGYMRRTGKRARYLRVE